MKVTVKLDDISPLINYRGNWEAGSVQGDGEALKYDPRISLSSFEV